MGHDIFVILFDHFVVAGHEHHFFLSGKNHFVGSVVVAKDVGLHHVYIDANGNCFVGVVGHVGVVVVGNYSGFFLGKDFYFSEGNWNIDGIQEIMNVHVDVRGDHSGCVLGCRIVKVFFCGEIFWTVVVVVSMVVREMAYSLYFGFFFDVCYVEQI